MAPYQCRPDEQLRSQHRIESRRACPGRREVQGGVQERPVQSTLSIDWLTDHGSWFLTRARVLTACSVQRVLVETPDLRDRIIGLGQYRANPCQHLVRLIEVRVGSTWYG